MLSRRKFNQAVAAVAGLPMANSPLFGYFQERQSVQTANRDLGRATVGKNVAATVHVIATAAADKIYQAGGNAVDAAVACAFCLGVVDGHNSGIGGGCLILIRTPSGKIHAIDGRETAPMASSPKLYLKDGRPSVELSQTGPLAVAVPSQVAALSNIHRRFALLPWATLLEPAIAAAEDGYVVGAATRDTIVAEQNDIAKFESSRSVLLKSDGTAYAIGETLRQPELAETLRQLSMHGPNWFYNGPFAKRCVEYLQRLGGVMQLSDLQNYRIVDRVPVESNYRGYRILGFPPPSSGGTHIAQMLNILGHFDVSALYQDSPVRYYHLLAECMKLAFADRAHWLGDSDFVQVPSFLADPAYAAQLATKINLEKATPVLGHGTGIAGDDSKKHTTHFTTADSLGNWVAITATVNTSWGSKVMVPGTGVMLNNQMDDFSIAPGVPNAFGLVGSEGNAIEPGKRPLSSMSPTLVLRNDGSPYLTCGAAGGPKIINATLQSVIGCLDLKLPIGKAIAMARVHHQWKPDVLYYENGLGGERSLSNGNNPKDDSIVSGLASRGHEMKSNNTLAIAQGIQVNDSNELVAASDPRLKP